MKWCIRIGDFTICVPLNEIVRQWMPPWWWPIENPRGRPGDPTPWKGRWIEAAQISDALQRELATIALMHELAKALTPDRAKPIQAVLQSAIHSDRDLPQGMTFTL
jgi:hypothetical protein